MVGEPGNNPTTSAADSSATIYDENPDAEDAELSPEKENFDSSFASKHKALFAAKSSEKEKIFQCNHCEYTSVRPYLIRRHLQTHCEERPHVCSICGRGFKTQNCLQNHTNVHRGVKNYKCQVNFCFNAYFYSTDLGKNLQILYENEKNFDVFGRKSPKEF